MKHHIRWIFLFCAAMLALPFAALFRTPAAEEALAATVTESPSAPAAEEADTGGQEPEDSQITIYNMDTESVETLPMTDYLCGVVMAEMPASFEEEALKAQAVLAHTYALRVAANEAESPSPDLQGASISTDPGRHQAYLSEEEARETYGEAYDTSYQKIRKCVESVADEILTYQGEPIIAAFHAISSGNTEAAENVWGEAVPYLVPCESEGDPLSPAYEDSLTLTTEEVKKILSEAYDGITFPDDEASWFEVTETTPSGYAAQVRVLDQELTGQELRSLFGLKSSDVTITYADGKFTFSTRGYGHGVGMSQYGADYMARQGSSYQEILAHYYPDTTLQEVS